LSGGGETDLRRLLANLSPSLDPRRFIFDTDNETADAFAIIREDEVTTVVRAIPEGEWARITLTVHSSLEAVGMTAAFAGALAEHGISANVIAGLFHDHIFVPWDRREEAVKVLQSLG
jgi:hypothetical protein